jgi:hypothetical protein
MSKVYVLTEGEFSDYRIVAVFSTREGAEKVLAGYPYTCIEIDEWTLDAIAEHEWGMTWYATINLSEGEAHRYYERQGFRHPTAVTVDFYRPADDAPFSTIQVRSPVSAEHAMKVAAEKRQEWLRTKELGAEVK